MQHSKWTESDNWVTVAGDISLKTAKRRGNGIIENYQREELDVAFRYLKTFDVALDIGAHVGIMSNRLSQKFNSVFSFELDPKIYDCLHENIIVRKKLTNVKIFNCGIGNVVEKVSISRGKKTFGTHITPNEPGNINVRPLDSFNIPGQISFIKMDVEGFEPQVIEGAYNLIKEHNPVILYERKGHQERYGYKDPDEPLRMLEDLGYVKYQDIGNARKNAVMGPKRKKGTQYAVHRNY